MAFPAFPVPFGAEDGWKHRTAEYVRGEPGVSRGWYQDGRKLRNVKASKAFIWPKDGKRGSTWGRMKDVLQNKGPDIFVAFGARPTDCVSNRPPRAQWSGHSHLDDRGMTFSFNSKKFAPFARAGLGSRSHGVRYDFATRKYTTPYRGMWSDAIWQQEPHKKDKWHKYPEALRTVDGHWWQDARQLPQFRGGPRDNKLGRGETAFHLPYGPSFMPPGPFWGGNTPFG
jgi:hypothetical protein